MLVAMRAPYVPRFAPALIRRRPPSHSFVTVGADATMTNTPPTGGTPTTTTPTTSSTFVVPTGRDLGIAAATGAGIATLAFVGTLWTAHPLIGALAMGIFGGFVAVFAVSNMPVPVK